MNRVNRRDLLKLGGMTVGQSALARIPLLGQLAAAGQPLRPVSALSPSAPEGKPDYSLRIQPVTVELDRSHIISTIGYNGTAPGPVLRMREGKPVSVEIINETDTPEFVHWHGMLIPSDVDGTEEEGSPLVPPHGRQQFQLTPSPAGSRWYHSHAMAMDDLHKGSYTGQFGFVYVEPANDPGHYDQELFLALRDWEPFFTGTMDDMDDDTHDGPLLEKPPTLNTDPDGLEVGSATYSINDKALGSGDPIRVREGQRLLIHLLNASAIENRRVALAGHKMKVIAIDGNPVPTPQILDSVFLGAGERVDVVVEMNQPGVWILGATERAIRESGLGVVVEYAGQHRPAAMDRSPQVPLGLHRLRRRLLKLDGAAAEYRSGPLRKFPGARANSTCGWSMGSPIRMSANLFCSRAPATGSPCATGLMTPTPCTCTAICGNWSRSTGKRQPAS